MLLSPTTVTPLFVAASYYNKIIPETAIRLLGATGSGMFAFGKPYAVMSKPK